MLDLWPLLNAVSMAASLLGGEPAVSWPDSSQVITFFAGLLLLFLFV